jgi:hypothetical protein
VSHTYTHPAHRLTQGRQSALLRKAAAEQSLRDAQEACHRTGAAWTEAPDSDAAYAAYSRACDAFGDARQELAAPAGSSPATAAVVPAGSSSASRRPRPVARTGSSRARGAQGSAS